MQLEQLRLNDIGSTSVWIPSIGDQANAMTHLAYLQFVHLAFYTTGDQLEALELSHEQINQGASNLIAVGMWFMGIESYINSLLRIACLATGNSFDDFKKKDFGPRLTSLFDILKIKKTPFYESTFQQIEEFKQYRNELFHDRTSDKPLAFKKTLFSGNPFFANQVDTMQAAKIAVSTFEAFRYVIPTLDLMPQVMILKNGSFFFKKLDGLYTELLEPLFHKTLEKHQLTTQLETRINQVNLEASPIFDGLEIQVLMKVVPDKKFDIKPSQERTSIGKDLMQKVIEGVKFDHENTMLIANYYR